MSAVGVNAYQIFGMPEKQSVGSLDATLAEARTTLGKNSVFVVLQDTLTRGERSLVGAGHGAAVLDLRRRWQGVMESEVSREIEALTGRTVVGFMSDNHIDPDLAVEVFVLAPVAGGDDDG